MKHLKLGSLFSGSGTWELAAVMCGIEPVWASEIEPFPIRVTTKRFPAMKHLGDIRNIDGTQIEAVDIITFSSPCQDISIAGKRVGLGGSRSNLFMEAIRIVREMRYATNNERPRFIAWENVPGVYSSNCGNDFRTVLEEIAESTIPMPESNKWAKAGMVELPDRQIAWRTLESSTWGVPQRRARVFLVADFGGYGAGEILFKPESLYRHFTESRETGKGTAEDSERSADVASGFGGISTIRAGADGSGNVVVGKTDYLTGWDVQDKRIFSDGGIAPTLAGSDGGGGRNPAGILFPLNAVGSLVARADGSPCVDRGQPFVVTTGFMAGQGSKAGGIGYHEEVSPTLKSVLSGGNTVPSIVSYPDVAGTLCASCAGMNRPGGQGSEADLCVVQISTEKNSYGFCPDNSAAAALTVTKRLGAVLCVGNGQVNQSLDFEMIGSLNCMNDQQAVLIDSDIAGLDCRNSKENGDICGTLQAKENGGYSNNYTHPVRIGKTVRRLTPTECLRLMGLPSWWADDVPHSDTALYKMCGNGVVLNCVLYIMRNIADALGWAANEKVIASN